MDALKQMNRSEVQIAGCHLQLCELNNFSNSLSYLSYGSDNFVKNQHMICDTETITGSDFRFTEYTKTIFMHPNKEITKTDLLL